jgi:hypothetical protein
VDPETCGSYYASLTSRLPRGIRSHFYPPGGAGSRRFQRVRLCLRPERLRAVIGATGLVDASDYGHDTRQPPLWVSASLISMETLVALSDVVVPIHQDHEECSMCISSW